MLYSNIVVPVLLRGGDTFAVYVFSPGYFFPSAGVFHFKHIPEIFLNFWSYTERALWVAMRYTVMGQGSRSFRVLNWIMGGIHGFSFGKIQTAFLLKCCNSSNEPSFLDSWAFTVLQNRVLNNIMHPWSLEKEDIWYFVFVGCNREYITILGKSMENFDVSQFRKFWLLNYGKIDKVLI